MSIGGGASMSHGCPFATKSGCGASAEHIFTRRLVSDSVPIGGGASMSHGCPFATKSGCGANAEHIFTRRLVSDSVPIGGGARWFHGCPSSRVSGRDVKCVFVNWILHNPDAHIGCPTLNNLLPCHT